MPATTPGHGLPYPVGTDQIDVAGDIRRLAEKLDALIGATSEGIVGEIRMYGGDVAPDDWLFARGQAILRATYPDLFAVYGIRFGAGDTTTTFNLPDFRGMYPFGHNLNGSYGQVGVGQRFGTKDGIVVVHTHTVGTHTHGVSITSGPQSANHAHGTGQAGQEFLTIGTGIGGPDPGVNAQNRTAKTGVQDTSHTHLVSGNTGGSTAHNTGSAGGAALNANLPPSVSVNFIVKVVA